LLRRGIVLQAIGRDADALDPLLRATVLAPTDPNVWLQTACALKAVGRPEQAEQAVAALRELRPREAALWFAAEVEQPLAPVAALSRAVYLAEFVSGAAAEQLLAKLATDYGEAAEPRIQHIVELATLWLAGLAAARGDGAEAFQLLDDLITRHAESSDSRVRVYVASALVMRGDLLVGSDRVSEGLATWDRVRTTYGDETALRALVAVALGKEAETYRKLHMSKERLSRLQEIVRRYADAPEPELRRAAAEAAASQGTVLAAAGDQRPAQDARADLIRRFRDDPDPIVARIVVKARVERWLAQRSPVARAAARPACRLLLLAPRLLYHERGGIALRQPRNRFAAGMGRALSVVGPILTIASILAVVVYAIRAVLDGDTTSGPVSVFVAAAIAGQGLSLLGRRLRGRFSVEMLRFVPARLPRTLFAAAAALGVAWISPAIERAGAVYTFGPPRYTYRLLGAAGLPDWAAIVAMIPIAPAELLLLAVLFTKVVVKPMRTLLGHENALVKALEDSFPTVSAGNGDE
jgi:tetratricopeptide (TPR) repeat protein